MIEYLGHYTATVKIRRDWEVKPEAEELDGKELTFQAMWKIDAEDSYIYVDEWAMGIREWVELGDNVPVWIASGDLINIEKCEGTANGAACVDKGTKTTTDGAIYCCDGAGIKKIEGNER